MPQYTVVLRYPDYFADDFPNDTFVARVWGDNPNQAAWIGKTQAYLTAYEEDPELLPEDFHCITVVEDWPAIYGGDEFTGTPRLWAEGQGPAPSTAANPEEDTP